jgi:hypothetical protein
MILLIKHSERDETYYISTRNWCKELNAAALPTFRTKLNVSLLNSEPSECIGEELGCSPTKFICYDANHAQQRYDHYVYRKQRAPWWIHRR